MTAEPTVALTAAWRDRLERAQGDPELARLAPGLEATVRFDIGGEAVDFAFRYGALTVGPTTEPQLVVSAPAQAWETCLQDPPPPAFHAFTAWELANPAFKVTGAPTLRAQARAALERVVELALTGEAAGPAAPAQRRLSQIEGRWREIETRAGRFELFYETAGAGTPLVMLHTAGADARQFQAQLADLGLAERFRMIAPDLPFHGRSLPPREWDGRPWLLTGALYAAFVEAILEQVAGEPAILLGGSMGAAIALVMAAQAPRLLRGVVGVEPPFRSRGRRNPYQAHVAVHGGLHNGAFVRGLMSPTSPAADRRRAAWIYSQGAPGVYPGDLAFYSEEFDGAAVAPRIDAAALPVALLSGGYDYSATPADGARLAALIPGARHILMPELGHFPMCEAPDVFRGYLCEALDFVQRAPADRPGA